MKEYKFTTSQTIHVLRMRFQLDDRLKIAESNSNQFLSKFPLRLRDHYIKSLLFDLHR